MAEHFLKKGKKYNVTVALNTLESYAGNGLIQQQFIRHGFTDVEMTGEGKTRKMIGTWSGEDTLFEDRHIENVEEL